jgi:phenylalanine-4-hydroxylase
VISQQEVIDSLPVHLRPFAAFQDYSRYTPRDQAVWRFLLHQLRENLSRTAHPVYLEGLAGTGIGLESIPRIEDMNRSLNEVGWRAVVVDGFIPPAIFMEFQAHRVLVVAVDVRTIEHMLYTPAPDIVHESAGHAPFIIDTDYAEFLQRCGELGMRAVSSQEDMAVYEAIRHLSIVKEAVASTPEDIRQAEAALQTAIAANKKPSEAALLARLHWWTVEYGLVGTTGDYRIFGAGLLSSLGESVNCLDDARVKKLPLTVDAIAQPYDITSEQPQLYVARNCRHLTQVQEEFAQHMCVNRGGLYAMEKAIEARTVNTAVTVAGLEISGVFTRASKDAAGNVTYFNTTGPTQLAYKGKQLPNHGTDYHSAGFGSPVGRLQAMERCLSAYTIDELKQHGIETGKPVTLDFLSGIRVRGDLKHILRRDQKNLIFSIAHCRVTAINGELLFALEWGTFDMAVGDAIVSVYGGSADQEAYPLYKKPSSQSTFITEYDQATRMRFDYYRKTRQLREQNSRDRQAVGALIDELNALNLNEWLLYFELLELAVQYELSPTACTGLIDRLRALMASGHEDQAKLIGYGLNRPAIALRARA